MPYSIETQDGIVIENIPDNVDRNSAELKQRVANERSRRRIKSPEFKQKLAAISAKSREENDPLNSMSGTEKVLANLGAGFDQAITGVRQLGTDIFGSNEDSAKMRQEVADKRQLNRQLADKTTGGRVLQFAGEVAPTLLIPGGAIAANAGRAGLVASGGAAGLLTGAITPLAEDEKRGSQMALQGAFGAALPLSLGLLADGASMLFRPSARASRAVQEGIVEPGMTAAQRRSVLQKSLAAVENEVQKKAAQAAGQTGQTALGSAARGQALSYADDIPLSVAARLEDPNLARLERGSRTRNGANWFGFDTNRARAVASAVEDATNEGTQLTARRATRSSNWDKNWASVEGAADHAKFASNMQQLPAELDALARSPSASNPLVRSAIDYVSKEVDRLGSSITPAHIQQMRAQLSGKANALASGNPLKQADRAAPATLNLMKRLDALLDDVTGGRFTGEVNAGYAADSRLVDAARAANDVRSRFWEINPNMTLGNIKNRVADLDTPAITESGLSKALSAAIGDNGGTRLSAPAAQRLEAVLNALRKQNIVQRVRDSATGGGGSNTASDILAARAAGAAAEVVGGPTAGIGNAIMQYVKKHTVGKADQLLAEALQDPEKLLPLIQRAAAKRPGGALTLEESEILNALRRMRGQP